MTPISMIVCVGAFAFVWILGIARIARIARRLQGARSENARLRSQLNDARATLAEIPAFVTLTERCERLAEEVETWRSRASIALAINLPDARVVDVSWHRGPGSREPSGHGGHGGEN